MMVIATMTINDYDELRQLWLNTPGMGLNEIDDSREGIARYLKRNPTTCFIAREEGQLVGSILSGHDGRRGYIYHTAVAVEARKQGVGSALVEYMIEALKEEGITKVALLAFANNELGNAFWESQGFTLRDDIVYRNKEIVRLEKIEI
ncbi:GNAT family N-acetyltransferase [Anaerosporobacter sp.]|uniref:GNAT family N-acetyltransferase n=1 Tax=Anaerosporobacter sp. TaxID=1872529 RepID=UPI00286F2A50|nr:GNAT family N-acetyltransferase [Anaerosporobacter sp.]